MAECSSAADAFKLAGRGESPMNVVAVILESIPSIDRAVGNDSGNFFDVFEAFSVMVFAAEYAGRLFCAPKNREALYSTAVYATTFFGIVDFLSTAPWFIEQE